MRKMNKLIRNASPLRVAENSSRAPFQRERSRMSTQMRSNDSTKFNNLACCGRQNLHELKVDIDMVVFHFPLERKRSYRIQNDPSRIK